MDSQIVKKKILKKKKEKITKKQTTNTTKKLHWEYFSLSPAHINNGGVDGAGSGPGRLDRMNFVAQVHQCPLFAGIVKHTQKKKKLN